MSQTAAAHGGRKAVSFSLLSDPDAFCETLTWSELQAKTAQAANLFRDLGIGETDVVAFVLPNATETILTYLGGQVAGIVNPINPLLDAEQIAAILRETKAKVVVTLRAFPKTDVAQKTAEAVRLAPDVSTVLEVDLHRYLTGVKRLIVPLIRPKNLVAHKAKVLDFNAELAKHPTSLAFADAEKDRVAAYFHTGGTTGMPKVVQHLYSGIVYNAWLGARLLFTEKDVQICPLPPVPCLCDDRVAWRLSWVGGAGRVSDAAGVSRDRRVRQFLETDRQAQGHLYDHGADSDVGADAAQGRC